MNIRPGAIIRAGIFFFFLIGLSCSNPENENAGATDDDAQNISEISSPQQRVHRRIRMTGHYRRRMVSGNDTVSIHPDSGRQSLPSSVILTEAEEKAISPEIAVAQYHPISNEITAMGKILANQYRQAIVSYPFPARVASIKAKIGEHVKKGQELMVLQSEEVGEATAAFYKANADYELAKVNFEREQQLFEKGVGAKKNYLVAETEMKVAEASLNATEKKLHVLGFSESGVEQISKTHQINPVISLYSPIEGKIVTSNVILGEMIDESTEILTIMDPSILWVEAEIYEKDIAMIRTGQEVVAEVPAYPGESFLGKITYISDLLNETTRTITVRSEVTNRSNRLKPGMFANLRIVLEIDGNALCIPANAVLDDQGRKLVFVKSNGIYYPREVEVGARNGDFITVHTALLESDTVVTSGNFQLKSKLYEEMLKNTGVR